MKMRSWTATRAYTISVICLVLGFGGGFFMRGSASSLTETVAVTAAASSSYRQQVPFEMQHAGAQAELPFRARLEANPKDFKLLVEAGEMYFQHRDYAEAGRYFNRALEVEDNVAVRNQYANALYFQGDADAALNQYARVLQAQPANDVALFNSGMVKFKAKNDGKGAIEAWKKILTAKPDHPQRKRIQAMIDQAKKSGAVGITLP